MTTTTTTSDPRRAAAIAWRRRQASLFCEVAKPWEHGTVMLTPSAPNFWDANFVRLEDAGISAEALSAAVDELLADYRHREIEIEDEAAGERLRPFFDAAGWVTNRNAVMHRTGRGRRHADVEDAALVDTHALRIEWYLEFENDEATQKALAIAQDRVFISRGIRAFVVRDPSGAAVGFTTLAVGKDAVEIDQLYVTPSARSRGIGRRLVEGALAAGGRESAWVVADDEGRARSLYERLGFETVWRHHVFIRQP